MRVSGKELTISAREIIQNELFAEEIPVATGMFMYMSKSSAHNGRIIRPGVSENYVTPILPDEPGASNNHSNDIL